MKNTWIKLSRDIQSHWLYQERRVFSKYEAWLDLIMMANHLTHKFVFGNEMVEVKRGEIITSETKLADKFKWSRKKIRDFLNLLEVDGMIVKKSDTKKTSIFISNYDKFQSIGTTKEQRRDNGETTERQQKDTNKNVYNDKNEKNDKEVSVPLEAAGVNKVFDVLYKINPMLNYGNRTQRSAALRLIQKLGEEKAVKSAEAAIAIFGKQYAPMIKDPLQLESKLPELVAYYKKNEFNSKQLTEV